MTTNSLDYGPLELLIGEWKGDRGIDVSPEKDGSERNDFFETILYEPVGNVSNAGVQNLVALRYHQVVSRKSNKEVFHNETGYWMWDAKESVVMHSLTIPRGVCLLAGGKITEKNFSKKVNIEVKASHQSDEWKIIESPFMSKKAQTLEFVHRIFVEGNQMSYEESILLDIYGKQFDHTEVNELEKV